LIQGVIINAEIIENAIYVGVGKLGSAKVILFSIGFSLSSKQL
jgi:hypothetical protein